MTEQPAHEPEPSEDEGVLPFDQDAKDPSDEPPSFDPAAFRYIGQGLTAGEFSQYADTYDFGTIPPDFIVLHHTAIPSTLQARYPSGQVWDASEQGQSPEAIKQKRKRQLDGIKREYARRPGWDSGPHIFIDDRYIWLFSPMNDVGIHAMWGNSFTDRHGRFHYSIGIEVLGYYEHVTWPSSVAALVAHTVAVLKNRLGTFDIDRCDNQAARARAGAGFALADRRKLRWGGISSHRDYNKPQCPGAAISDEYYMRVLNGGSRPLHGFGSDRPQPGHYAVTTATANIREGPGRQSNIADQGRAKVAGGTVLEFYEIVLGEDIGGNPWWGHLTSQLGFVSMTLVERRD